MISLYPPCAAHWWHWWISCISAGLKLWKYSCFPSTQRTPCSFHSGCIFLMGHAMLTVSGSLFVLLQPAFRTLGRWAAAWNYLKDMARLWEQNDAYVATMHCFGRFTTWLGSMICWQEWLRINSGTVIKQIRNFFLRLACHCSHTSSWNCENVTLQYICIPIWNFFWGCQHISICGSPWQGWLWQDDLAITGLTAGYISFLLHHWLFQCCKWFSQYCCLWCV